MKGPPVKTLLIVMVVLLVSSVLQAQSNIPIPTPRPSAPALPPALQGMPPAHVELYRALGLNALWVADGAPSPLAAELREALLAADTHGLNSAEYWTPALELQFQSLAPATAEDFERAATAALMKYASDLSVGRVNPQSVGDEVKLAKRTLSIDALSAAMKNASAPLSESLEVLAPRWPAYRNLRAALARLRAVDAAVDYPAVSAPAKGPTLGTSAPIVSLVKTRLRTLGYALSETGPVYSQELLTQLKKYYADNTLPGEVTLRADSQFWPHISVPLGSRIQQIQLTMEKLRWIPNGPDARYFDVNLALQRLRIYENGELVMSMKTINGRSKRKSPTLKDKLTVVELNPSWTVPVRLILEDKLPIVRKDPYFLSDHGYRIFDQSGRVEYSWWDINWDNLNRNNVDDIILRQGPGTGNALGVMKFHLTNPYAIYLHDTNERNLFVENHRLLSSGCIRLERPVDVALYLLRDQPRWNDRATLESQLAKAVFAEPWIPQMKRLSLSQSVPVYLNYLTAEADDDGLVKFANDYYGQDTALFNLLKARR